MPRSLVYTIIIIVITLELEVDKWKQNVVVSLKCLNFVNYNIFIKVTTIIGLNILKKLNYNNFLTKCDFFSSKIIRGVIYILKNYTFKSRILFFIKCWIKKINNQLQ